MIKARVLFLILFITKVAIAHSLPINVKGKLSGIITDASTNLPLQGVTVFIADLKSGTNTNAKGEFVINNISEGLHLLEISHIGYTTIAENIIIDADTKKDFLLSQSIVENNAVVVTGVSKATQLKKLPFQVAVMRKEELQQSASTNIVEAITKKAGVYSLSTGPAISKPMIRGLSYNRVLTINDGVRQEGQQWGDEHGLEIDEASVSKVEIFKGPASLIYGSDAMAGVINILTNVPVQTNTIKLNVGSNYHTNNDLVSFNGNFAGNIKGWNWNVYGTKREASDYKNKRDGYVFNSKFNEKNYGGYIGYNGSWGYSHLLVSKFNLKAGLIEGERDADGFFIKQVPGGEERVTDKDFKSTDPMIPYQHIIHSKIALDNNFKVGLHRLAINIGHQQNERQEFGNIDDAQERSLFFDLRTFTYTGSLQFKETNGWKTSLGINGMKQINSNKGIEQLIPDYVLFDFGSYLFAAKEFKNVNVSGGVRYDKRYLATQNLLDALSIKRAAFNREYDNFSGSLGLTIPLSKNINLKMNIAKAFRAPGIPELASNGSHEGTQRYEYGDVDLKSEKSTQVDGGLDFSNQHFSVNIAGYFNDFKNFIFYRKLETVSGVDSTIDVNGEILQAFTFDQQKALLAGAEITLDIHPHPLDWLHLQNSFSFVSGRLKESIEGSRNLPFIPAPKLLTEVRGDFKKLTSNIFNTYAKVEIDNTFKQAHPFTAFDTETTTPAYTLINAGIGAEVGDKKGNILFGLHFIATNIADVAYQSHLSRLKYAPLNNATGRMGVFGTGRNFIIKINVPFTQKIKS
ncbi:MAG: TonB-dependent receptor [Ferruginibacter sp.]